MSARPFQTDSPKIEAVAFSAYLPANAAESRSEIAASSAWTSATRAAVWSVDGLADGAVATGVAAPASNDPHSIGGGEGAIGSLLSRQPKSIEPLKTTRQPSSGERIARTVASGIRDATTRRRL